MYKLTERESEPSYIITQRIKPHFYMRICFVHAKLSTYIVVKCVSVCFSYARDFLMEIDIMQKIRAVPHATMFWLLAF